MKDFFKELVQIYKTKVKIRQLKKKSIENFSRFYVSFIDQDRNPKEKKDKYLQLKKIGLNYILDNQDLIYSEINK